MLFYFVIFLFSIVQTGFIRMSYGYKHETKVTFSIHFIWIDEKSTYLLHSLKITIYNLYIIYIVIEIKKVILLVKIFFCIVEVNVINSSTHSNHSLLYLRLHYLRLHMGGKINYFCICVIKLFDDIQSITFLVFMILQNLFLVD